MSWGQGKRVRKGRVVKLQDIPVECFSIIAKFIPVHMYHKLRTVNRAFNCSLAIGSTIFNNCWATETLKWISFVDTRGYGGNDFTKIGMKVYFPSSEIKKLSKKDRVNMYRLAYPLPRDCYKCWRDTNGWYNRYDRLPREFTELPDCHIMFSCVGCETTWYSCLECTIKKHKMGNDCDICKDEYCPKCSISKLNRPECDCLICEDCYEENIVSCVKCEMTTCIEHEDDCFIECEGCHEKFCPFFINSKLQSGHNFFD